MLCFEYVMVYCFPMEIPFQRFGVMLLFCSERGHCQNLMQMCYREVFSEQNVLFVYQFIGAGVL